MQHHVIKEGDLFLVADEEGNVSAGGTGAGGGFAQMGLFTSDTRFLSRYELTIEGRRPVLLASDASRNYIASIRLTNPEMELPGGQPLPRESIFLRRTRFINRRLYERIEVSNFNLFPVKLGLELRFGSDFADIFEVRGWRRQAHGRIRPPEVEPGRVVQAYDGLDGLRRTMEIRFVSPAPDTVKICDATTTNAEVVARFNLPLPAKGKMRLDLVVIPGIVPPETPGTLPPEVAPRGTLPFAPFDRALADLEDSYRQWQEQCTQVESDNPDLNATLRRSLLDLRVLMTDPGRGNFPVAGVPWFAVPFGRDSLITALQLLPYNSQVARSTLRTLAHFQGEKVDPWREEEPGKILHEMRQGEASNRDELPFRRYYGSIDSTLLFIVLLSETFRWTGDVDLVREMAGPLQKALEWLDTYGDRDGDGYVEYHQESSGGLANQAWKDSGDSVSHVDGTLARSPMAMAEVQGYAYAARLRAAELLEVLGERDAAQKLKDRAIALKAAFHRDFWSEERQYFATALDGEKKRVETVTSNPGHCLWSGLLEPERAARVAKVLTSPEMFSGWGIRTMSTVEARYNPISYHNGSVWPHDNSLMALGLKRYGFDAAVNQVATGLLQAANHFEYHRLPELFCGFPSAEEPAPVSYPTACSPQAWAAGAPLALVQAMLGLFPEVRETHGKGAAVTAARKTAGEGASGTTLGTASGTAISPMVELNLRPVLPGWLNWIKIRRLRVAGAVMDIHVHRLKNGQHAVRIRFLAGADQVSIHCEEADYKLVG
ncbi:MAG: amylo-alpha-1,6-glucosidase [Firmicutes bacterium]|nr:amylo-alpha-1,6-glucosidase [Bacillota bacterium]